MRKGGGLMEKNSNLDHKSIFALSTVVIGWIFLYYTINSNLDSAKKELQNEIISLRKEIVSAQEKYDVKIEKYRSECLHFFSNKYLGLSDYERATNKRIRDIEEYIWSNDGEYTDEEYEENTNPNDSTSD